MKRGSVYRCGALGGDGSRVAFRGCLRFWMTLVPCAVVVWAVCGVVGASAAPYSAFHFGETKCQNEAEAGQLCLPVGVGVDVAGNVYVADEYDHRVNKFDKTGRFLSAWGWGVVDGAPELQVCTTFCQVGESGSAMTEFDLPQGVAVDAGGNVYVFDKGHYRVEKFDSEGKFLLMFGHDVNKNGTNVCTVAEEKECQPGTAGTGNGEFTESALSRSYVTIGGPGGENVYVGDTARVQVFTLLGAYRETLSLSSLSKKGVVTALAVDPQGDVFVKIGDDENGEEAVPGVREFEPKGPGVWVESSIEFDAGSNTVHAIAVDGSGHLYVGDTEGGFHVLKYAVASGVELAAFGFGTAANAFGMAISGTENKLYVSDAEMRGGEIWAYSLPEAGPLVEPGSERVTAEPRGGAVFEGTVDPEGFSTGVKVQYSSEADFEKEVGGKACEWSCVTGETTPVSVGSGFTDQPVTVKLPTKTLTPGVNYHWRLVASNSQGTQTPEGPVFEEFPAAVVEGPWATEVASTSATLSARIDPRGVSTSYRLEYGTSTAYENVLVGNVGAGEGYVLISYPRQGLLPGTTYHFRLVATNVVGGVEVADRTFTTQAAVSLSVLPDGRAWELVSPADKHGALIEPTEGVGGDVQAAVDGSAVGYVADEPVTDNPPGNAESYVVSTRDSSSGWGSQEILPSQSLPEGEEQSGSLLVGATLPLLFSPDLAMSVIEPNEAVPPSSLSPEATERTIFLHNTESGVWTPLVTPADVETGEKFGGSSVNRMHFLTATPDLSHVVFESPYALTKGSLPVPDIKECEGGVCSGEENLYEWREPGVDGCGQVPGCLVQVNVLPDGQGTFNGFLGRYNIDLVHVISDDGRWVAWEYKDSNGVHMVYVRDMVEGKTMQVGDRHAVFQGMSADGSRVFFLDGPRVEGSVSYDLYELNTVTGVTTDVTGSHGGGEISAGVKDAVVGASKDGSYVYFVATGVLANGGVRGGDNLYVAHEQGGVWSIGLVATLSADDEKDWSALQEGVPGEIRFSSYQRNEQITSRVSPGGRFVAFMSDRSLTGYDNRDAVSGQPDEEVFEYDASSGRVVCVSCNPSGARPVGVFDSGGGVGSLLVDREGSWQGHWLAGSMIGWREVQSGRAVYQPRNLSDSGRLFFESPDALVPRDTNGLEDVYEYEPVKGPEGPSSNDCTSGSERFSERSNGCVGLISAGTSGAESAFYDASANGDDVFFLTASKLVSADYDNSFDVYDAHVCSSSVPCSSEPVRPPECDSGDSCKAAPAAQPEIFGPAPSATFSGAGNVPPPPTKPVVKALSRAQKLTRALRACRKKKNRRERGSCERVAHGRYARKTAAKGRRGR